MSTIMLCTDLDGTLLPNGLLPVSANANQRFNRLVASSDIILVYVTGRDLVLVEQAMIDYQIPQPDFIIADVGTTIYRANNGGWQSCSAWQKTMGLAWSGKQAMDIHPLLQGLQPLQLQEKQKQNCYKLSYYIPIGMDYTELLASIKQRLQAQQITAQLIVSVDPNANTGLLDILPNTANKLYAIHFLINSLAIQQTNVLFAGDSGNDLVVLTSSIKSVLVANATTEFKQQVLATAKQLNRLDSLYLAKGGLGMNGNYSAGILEGMVYFFPLTREWLDET